MLTGHEKVVYLTKLEIAKYIADQLEGTLCDENPVDILQDLYTILGGTTDELWKRAERIKTARNVPPEISKEQLVDEKYRNEAHDIKTAEEFPEDE